MRWYLQFAEFYVTWEEAMAEDENCIDDEVSSETVHPVAKSCLALPGRITALT